MKIRDTLVRDPSDLLANNGQARISTVTDDKAMAALRYELSTFVCEGEYRKALEIFLPSYLANLGRRDTAQKSVWVSGFYGSGKSHLLKMAAHLWQNTVFDDGATARSLVHDLPDEIANLLQEVDAESKKSGGRLAASGTLLSGTTDNVRLSILSVILRATGLPEQYPQARFCLWLHGQGQLAAVKASVEAAGRDFARELNNLFVSGAIAKAVMAAIPGFAATEADARQLFKAQFPASQGDIPTPEFIRIAKEALLRLSGNGKLPCTLLILDEVQQYIGDSHDRSVLVTEVAEAVSKEFDGHLMLIAAGQSALTDVPQLQKMLDRFTIRPNLQDADVETVTRKVLLKKRADSVGTIKTVLERHGGEISRQLNGTKIGERSSDRQTIVDDYPLLPVRRRFWEECFRQIDAAGTSSQLRSQLRIVNDAVGKVADAEVGRVIPADELYDALAPDMSTTGILLREINERIIEVGRTDGELARRICGLVFLIGKLKRGEGDLGIRATKEHVADLLVDDLNADNGKLRDEVDKTLKSLADRSILMSVAGEYRLQTREGAEWDNDFRTRVQKIQSDDTTIQIHRNRVLYAAVEAQIGTVKVIQGAAKESRRFAVTREETAPAVSGTDIPIWIHDGFSSSEKDFVGEARKAGVESPILFVFIPRQHAEDLRRAIVEEDAAKQTLDTRGNPESDEGKQARASMDSRRVALTEEKDRLVAEIAANTKVFQGGGSELLESTLAEKIKTGSDASLVRLFPRFGEADFSEWGRAISRAKEGAEQPFEPVGHKDAVEAHPVCKEVLSKIGAGASGTDIRKELKGVPYGWPQDAVDAALIALHRTEHISAKLNGTPIAVGQLDQGKIAKAEFRVEKLTLSVQQKIQLRNLFQKLEIKSKAGEETAKAPEFLNALIALARSAGGDPPLPAAPATTTIEDTLRLAGNEQLVQIHASIDTIQSNIKTWQDLKALAVKRMPQWQLLGRLMKHGAGVAEVEVRLGEVDAISSGRMLLDSIDPVAPIVKAVVGVLRGEIQKLRSEYNENVFAGLDYLSTNSTWAKIDDVQRTELLEKHKLAVLQDPAVATDDEVATFLDLQSLSRLKELIESIPGRIDNLLKEAAKLLEPKVQYFTVPRDLLRTPDDVDGWVARQRENLMAAIEAGPVQVN